jgi:hypothetical protein
MSRMGGDAIVVRPTNNVYTVLVILAFLLQVVAFVVMFMRAQHLFPQSGLF